MSTGSRRGAAPVSLAGADLAVVLGSGLAELESRYRPVHRIAYGSIDGLGLPSVTGHPGWISKRLVGRIPVLFFAGRRHFYEGGGDGHRGGIARIATELGCRHLLLTQAAGSLVPDLPAGTWYVPDDIVALPAHGFCGGRTGRSGHAGPLISTRFRGIVEESVTAAGVRWSGGTLCWTTGPAYETAAEAGAAAWAGARAASMSAMPELVEARRSGIEAACLSWITNSTANIEFSGTCHDEVLGMGGQGTELLGCILERLVRKLRHSRTGSA